MTTHLCPDDALEDEGLTDEAGLLGSKDATSPIGEESESCHAAGNTKDDALQRLHASSRRHLIAMLALCACTLCNAYLLISPFLYAGYMSMHLIPTLNSENAGTYAGLLSSSFMVGRVVTSYAWGHVSDVYGRKVSLLTSLALSCLWSVAFGLSGTFAAALASRFMLGMSACIMVVTKTYVSELARGDEKLEAKAMGMIVGMRGWGFLLFPAASGVLSDPVKQHPNWEMGAFRPILTKYPYLMPNVVGAFLCLIAFLGAALFIEETLPQGQRRPIAKTYHDVLTLLSSRCNAYQTWMYSGISYIGRRRGIVLSFGRESDQVRQGEPTETCIAQQSKRFVDINETKDPLAVAMQCSTFASHPKSPSMPTEDVGVGRKDIHERNSQITSWQRPIARRLLLFYCLWSFVVFCMDEVFPLFCISKAAGLDLSEKTIGGVLSTSGFLYVILQYPIYTHAMSRFGLYGSLRLSAFLGVPIVAFVPISLLLNRGAIKGEINWPTFAFLGVILAVARIFNSTWFACMTIAMNRSVPDSCRGKMNGLSMTGGSVAKALAPTVSGSLASICFSARPLEPYAGSIIVFLVISSLALCVAIASSIAFLDCETTDDDLGAKYEEVELRAIYDDEEE